MHWITAISINYRAILLRPFYVSLMGFLSSFPIKYTCTYAQVSGCSDEKFGINFPRFFIYALFAFLESSVAYYPFERLSRREHIEGIVLSKLYLRQAGDGRSSTSRIIIGCDISHTDHQTKPVAEAIFHKIWM
ncbi:hypothetical protein IQ07DRAFT_350144 [Pyrenochaeta sp. DS3sAY3a]|nr:hypothetical protein IQ07DRAFT_350144 [Pyrenochaeta sp. DS3sAY3a]